MNGTDLFKRIVRHRHEKIKINLQEKAELRVKDSLISSDVSIDQPATFCEKDDLWMKS